MTFKSNKPVDSLALESSKPIASGKDLQSSIQQFNFKGLPTSVYLSQHINENAQITIPSGTTVYIDLKGYTLNLALNVKGTLVISNGTLSNKLTTVSTSVITANNIVFTGSQVSDGPVANSKFTSCVYPLDFNGNNPVTSTVIQGNVTGSGTITFNTLSGTNISLQGSINLLGTTLLDSVITITGDWVNTSELGTGTNILARNISTGSGNITGPGSSTDNAIARWDSTTGQVLQNSSAIVNDDGDLSANRPTIDLITNQTLTSSFTRFVITNKGAATRLDLTLPPATEGLDLSFSIWDSVGIRIIADAADTLVMDNYVSPVGGYIESFSIGDTIRLTATEGNTWYTLNKNDYHRYNSTVEIEDLQAQITNVSGLMIAGDAALDSYIDTVSGLLQDHIDDVSNPHNVTPTQVGNATAQWNANKLQGYDVIFNIAPVDGQVLTWDSHDDVWYAEYPYNFVDSTFNIRDQADGTKKVMFEVSGVTTGTTRTLTVPNQSGTIALDSDLNDLEAYVVLVSGSLQDQIDDINSELTVDLNDLQAQIVAVSGQRVSGDADLQIQITTVSGLMTSGDATNAANIVTVSGVLQTQINSRPVNTEAGIINSLLRYASSGLGAGVKNSPLTVDDFGVLSGHRRGVQNVTSLTTSLASSSTGTIYTNLGAAAQIELLLPSITSLTSNIYFTFVVHNSFGIKITANTGEVIAYRGTTTSPAGNIILDKVGDSITLVANPDLTTWHTIDTNIADLSGPTSSTDNAITRFDGTTGKLVQDSNVFITDSGVLYGNKTSIVNLTGNTTLTSADSNKLYTNVGATSLVEITLPTVVGNNGVQYSFVCYEDDGIDIDPQTGEYIVGIDGTATDPGTALRLDTPGDSITIVPVGDGLGWYCVAYNGKGVMDGNSVWGVSAATDGPPNPITATVSGTFLGFNGTTVQFMTTPAGVTDHTALTSIGTNSHVDIDSHIANTSNPHSVTASQVGNTSAQWNANKLQGADLVITTPLTGQVLTYSGTNWINVMPSAPGTGDVVGPGSATDNAIARFDTGTGKLIQNSNVTLDDDGDILFTNAGGNTIRNDTGKLSLGTASHDIEIVAGVNAGLAANGHVDLSADVDSNGAGTIRHTVSGTLQLVSDTFATSGLAPANTSTFVPEDESPEYYIVHQGNAPSIRHKVSPVVGGTSGLTELDLPPVYTSVKDVTTGVGFQPLIEETVSTAGEVAGKAVSADYMSLVLIAGGKALFTVDKTNGFRGLGSYSARLKRNPSAGTAALSFNNSNSSIGIGADTSSTISFYDSVGKTFTFGLDFFKGANVYGAGFSAAYIHREGERAVGPIYSFHDDTNSGIGSGAAGDMVSVFNGGVETFTFDTDNLQGVDAASDSKPYIRKGRDYGVQSTVIYGFNPSTGTGLSQYSGANTMSFHANGKAVFTLDGGTYPSLYGLDPGATSADQPKIRSFGGDTSSRPIYSFALSDNWGMSIEGAGVALINGGVAQINAMSDGIWEAASSIDSSTSTSNLTANAATANLHKWVASWSTSQTISIDNLTAGRFVEIWVKNTHGSAEPAVTIQASTTTSGHSTVSFAVGNGFANVSTGIKLSAGTWCLFRVRNVNGDFVGYML
jgi:hypothetical protein